MVPQSHRHERGDVGGLALGQGLATQDLTQLVAAHLLRSQGEFVEFEHPPPLLLLGRLPVGLLPGHTGGAVLATLGRG